MDTVDLIVMQNVDNKQILDDFQILQADSVEILTGII